MCKEYPGPRCSNHAGLKKDKAWKELLETQASYPAGSLEVKQAERAFYEASEEYKSTPDGLKEVEKNEPEKLDYYRKVRDFQVEALNETRNGRTDQVSSVLADSQNFYDQEEVLSVLNSSRRYEERQALKNASSLAPLSKEERALRYSEIMSRYESILQQNGQLTPANKAIISSLRNQTPPVEVSTLNNYANAFAALTKSRTLLRKEIQRIAVLQDVSVKVAEAYHDAYREEYKTRYASLPTKQQPNPPKEWVEGTYTITGFRNDVSTHLIPSDPATMYATYRLRSDMNSIPDYLKNSRVIATVNLDEGQSKVAVAIYNNKGKKIEHLVSSTSNAYEVVDKLKGKIIVLDNDKRNHAWLAELNQRHPLNSSLLSTHEFSSKHLNLPDSSLPTLCQAVGVKDDTSFEGKPVTVLKAYFHSKQKIASKWQSKTVRKNAPNIETLPLTSRWA